MESLSAVVLDMSPPRGSFLSARPPGASLSLTQMLLLNAVVCGVEICACAGFTYIPPMLLKAGYSEENMGFLLGLGPLFGFFLVPIIGRASDRCYSRFGRRRPFILGLAIPLVLSLYLIPFGEYFASLIVGVSLASKRLGVWGLTLGVVLLDFTTQACLTPCEALLNDASKESEQNEKIFTIYSLMISLGGIIGYLLTAIDWTSNPLGEYFGGQEASIFSILILIFTMLLAATLFVAHEIPLIPQPANASFSSSSSSSSSLLSPSTTKQSLSLSSSSSSSSPSSSNPPSSKGIGSNDQSSPASQGEPDSGKNSTGAITTSDRTRLPRVLRTPSTSNWLCRYARRTVATTLNMLPGQGRFLRSACSCVCSLARLTVPRQLAQLFQIPKVLRLLAMADFCSWTAIMGFNIYYTDYVGQVVYGGNPNAHESSPEGRAYDEGVRIASWGLLLHCICSAIFSFFIERLTASLGYRATFSLGMTAFALAMMGMMLVRHIFFVNLMAAITGFAYATVTTIPFMLVSKYHNNKKIYFMDVYNNADEEIERGIGADMAVLDWSYFLSQVVLTGSMGAIVHVTGTLVSYMVTAGSMGILAIYYIGHIVDNEAMARRVLAVR